MFVDFELAGKQNRKELVEISERLILWSKLVLGFLELMMIPKRFLKIKVSTGGYIWTRSL